MRRLLIVAAIGVLPLSFAFGSLAGTAHADVNQHGNHYSVTLICPQLAEDSAANVRLVTYEHSTAPGSNTVIVYRCKRFGY